MERSEGRPATRLLWSRTVADDVERKNSARHDPRQVSKVRQPIFTLIQYEVECLCFLESRIRKDTNRRRVERRNLMTEGLLVII